jgi:hypothetical protein
MAAKEVAMLTGLTARCVNYIAEAWLVYAFETYRCETFIPTCALPLKAVSSVVAGVRWYQFCLCLFRLLMLNVTSRSKKSF